MYGKKIIFSDPRIYEIFIMPDRRLIYVQKIIIGIYQNEIPLKLKAHKHSTKEKRDNYERKKIG